MSILDKASLIQIPSGYKSTKLYSIKPSNGDGDFTFARSSSGTRVNSEGLIEVAGVVSTTEQVNNGDFSGSSTGWTESGTWTYGNNNEVCTGNGTNQVLTQSGILTTGTKYKYSIDIISSTLSSQQIRFYLGGTDYVTYTLNGGAETISAYADAAGTNLSIRVTSSNTSGVLTIDNVSVKEVIENDVPRLDYSATCASLLLEGQRTNVLVHSTNFSGGWALDDATKVSNSTTSPDGTVNAITLIGNTNASRHHIRQGAAGSVTASLSVFAKAKELRYLQIATINTISQYVNFDVSNGTIGTVGSAFTDAKIEDYGNGWYRCSVTSTNQYNAMYISLVSSLTSSWLESWTMSNNTDGLYLYGAQLEQGSYATSYIPTSGSTVTRTSDVCNNAGTSATFNSTEGVLFAEIAALADDGTNRRLSISDGTTSNRVLIAYNTISNQIQAIINSGTVNITHIVSDVKSFIKIGFKYKENDCALWVNGVQVATDTNATMPLGLNKLQYNDGGGGLPFYGKTKQLMVFNEALSDEELSDLTGQVNLSFNNLATFYNYTIL